MLGLLGDEWTLLILQQALLGATRYADFVTRLPISNSVLTRRLRTLCAEGLLERREYQTNPSRSEYLVTPKSRSLWPVLLSMWEWERRWVPDHAQTVPEMHHTVCGHRFSPVTTCRACGQTVTEKDVVAQWGPSGSWPRSVPWSTTRRRSEQADAAEMFPHTMSVIGNRWGFALTVAAFVGMSRFADFQAQLGAPPGSVADRLAILTANEVFAAAGNRYALTEKGRALFPVVVTALQWAQRWFDAPEGPAVLVSHTACGRRFTAALTCDRCAQALRGTQVLAVEN